MGSLPASQRPMRICADASPPPPPGGCEYLPGREGERGGGRMGKGGRTASGRPAGRLPQVHNQTWANHAAAAASRIPALPARHSGGGDRGGGPAPVLVEVRGGRATGRGGEGPAGRGGGAGRAGGAGGVGAGGSCRHRSTQPKAHREGRRAAREGMEEPMRPAPRGPAAGARRRRFGRGGGGSAPSGVAGNHTPLHPPPPSAPTGENNEAATTVLHPGVRPEWIHSAASRRH